MNNELLLLTGTHTDTLIEQTKTKPQEAVEFEIKEQLQTFLFNPPINLSEEGKWLLAVIIFAATNSVFDITSENNRFSISIPGHWNSKDGEELIKKLYKFLEPRSENDINLHVKKVERKGTRKEIKNSEYNLAGFDHFESEIISEQKREKKRVRRYGLQITYDEIIDILDVKFIGGSTIGYTLPPGVYKISDINLMLKSLLPGEVKVNITVDDIRLKTKLNNNKTIRFTKKSFLYYFRIYGIILGKIRCFSRFCSTDSRKL